MSKKRPSKHLRPARPLLAGGSQQVEHRGATEFVVRRVAAHQAVKEYRCPGCQHRIAPATAHLVTWPISGPFGAASGVEARRHWHEHCWRSAR